MQHQAILYKRIIHKVNYQSEHISLTSIIKILISQEEYSHLKEELTSKHNFKYTTQNPINESHAIALTNTQEYNQDNILINKHSTLEQTQELISQILAEYILAEEKTK